MAACGPSTGLSQARESHEHMSREEIGHGSDPTRFTEARIGIVIHLYPAISWYQAGGGGGGLFQCPLLDTIISTLSFRLPPVPAAVVRSAPGTIDSTYHQVAPAWGCSDRRQLPGLSGP